MSTRPKLNVHVYDFRGKAHRIAAAIERAGARLVDDPAASDVTLVNHDNPAVPEAVERGEKAKANGASVVIYPDGGGVPLVTAWDGRWPVADYVDGMLVTGPGEAEICRRYGYPNPVAPIGWTLSRVARRQLRPRRVRSVLFAPSHPPCLEHSAAVNSRLFGELAEIARAGRIERVVIRHLGTIEENGLPPEFDFGAARVEFSPGRWDDFDVQRRLIESCDLVVAGDPGTFATLALARGRPVVMCDSDRTDLVDHGAGEPAAHESEYRDFMRYPFDAARADLDELIDLAATDVAQRREWCGRFVGGSLDGREILRSLTAIRG